MSIVLAATFIGTDIWLFRRVNGLDEKAREEFNQPARLMIVAFVGDTVITIALFFNALKVQSAGIYVTALIWSILVAFVSYLRLLGFAKGRH